MLHRGDLTVPDSLSLRPRAEISLDLRLVHAVQREHEENPAKPQRPEGVSLCGIWVQAAGKRQGVETKLILKNFKIRLSV